MKGHQQWWLAGGYDLEIGHFQSWIAWWLACIYGFFAQCSALVGYQTQSHVKSMNSKQRYDSQCKAKQKLNASKTPCARSKGHCSSHTKESSSLKLCNVILF